MTMTVQNVSFTSNNDDRRVTASEVGVATGATVGGAKYGTSAIKRFKNFSKGKNLTQLSAQTTQQIKDVANTSKKVKSLWGRMFANAKTYKNAIVDWAKKTATGKVAQKVVKSKAFGKASAVVGGIGAAFVFISGIGEMGQTFSKLANKGDTFEPAYQD